ncbi:MAG TPA: transketolase C-terminal domain-containing protein [Rectinemataceae bacterium]|nr:transketolase C-terminal domain-containing protein [Rectinemataceae bacterium]
MSEPKSLRVAYGEALVELGATNDRMVVLDADLAHATMTSLFEAKYPERFFNFGLAEANMMCAAAGFAHSGLLPFASTFALFGAGRAYEQIRNSISYVGANVKLGLSHSGLSVGEDGGSHQSIEDIALMRGLPGMTVLVPCDPIQTRKAVFAAAAIEGPVYIRVARPVVENLSAEDEAFVPGQAVILRDGRDVCIAATGLMVREALRAADALAAEGIQASVLNFHTIKPLDSVRVLEWARRCGAIVTVEEHSVIGGLGSAVAEVLAGQSDASFERIGIQDLFGSSGKPSELFAAYGLCAENIASRCRALLRRKARP